MQLQHCDCARAVVYTFRNRAARINYARRKSHLARIPIDKHLRARARERKKKSPLPWPVMQVGARKITKEREEKTYGKPIRSRVMGRSGIGGDRDARGLSWPIGCHALAAAFSARAVNLRLARVPGPAAAAAAALGVRARASHVR